MCRICIKHFHLQSSKFTHTITCAIMVNSDEAHNF
ncbi:hypothetical protein VP217E381_P0061 [Vibrio phage 217E38-1]|nr:hypothetical protein VP511E551_P0065 [Vibrio phage 511E55-1]CAH9016781.1 hypothetical protein VP217E381_P0061 [Vibrio phage 217E38-1]